MKDDILKFELFRTYKEEIIKAKERYKPVLLELLKAGKIRSYTYIGIIELWEEEWKEESNQEIDKLKFEKRIFKYYKEEISKDKEKYKPVLLKALEEDSISEYIYEEIIELWEKERKGVRKNLDSFLIAKKV